MTGPAGAEAAAAGVDPAAAGSTEVDPTGSSAALAFTHSTSSWQVFSRQLYDPTDDNHDVSEPEICRILGEKTEASAQLRGDRCQRFADVSATIPRKEVYVAAFVPIAKLSSPDDRAQRLSAGSACSDDEEGGEEDETSVAATVGTDASSQMGGDDSAAGDLAHAMLCIDSLFGDAGSGHSLFGGAPDAATHQLVGAGIEDVDLANRLRLLDSWGGIMTVGAPSASQPMQAGPAHHEQHTNIPSGACKPSASISSRAGLPSVPYGMGAPQFSIGASAGSLRSSGGDSTCSGAALSGPHTRPPSAGRCSLRTSPSVAGQPAPAQHMALGGMPPLPGALPVHMGQGSQPPMLPLPLPPFQAQQQAGHLRPPGARASP
ncbi:hypothetical protein EMIHUDRAFT_449153 [Emiliania huxleyi CCMP1516]|uniref:Uncharacterized protein n=2 Tax=Emiliania huxleyi TaxID=2903 RepID=A0A0D3KME0_EMIH1|nr:hypothetical protein EMIHUDRAFT_449153 [Emiliania huxleyi CCMP1516]EOD36925.1 hypothetical protein EMIHUDRAFT_449153 [Emiliania huxleyi CCMP1516]|eukprot:XP_005789354.1 hypothetical protein EMIHUDRAFT_449153 [Emiliania huxleyi CCMP1516]